MTTSQRIAAALAAAGLAVGGAYLTAGGSPQPPTAVSAPGIPDAGGDAESDALREAAELEAANPMRVVLPTGEAVYVRADGGSP